MNLRNFFALLVVIFSCVSNYTSSEVRILSGSPRNIEASKYLVSIRYMDIDYCVGSLVTVERVVTSASCIVNLQKNEISVGAGATDLRYIPLTGQTRGVAWIYVPWDYDPQTEHMNIAVMKLCDPFHKSNTVDTIKFCGAPLKEGQEMRISGWGWTTTENGDMSNILQSTVLFTWAMDKCEILYATKGITLTSSMICAAYGSRDVGVGDYGGPGVVDEELCAVVSHNPLCSGIAFPTVFTTLSDIRVLDFIHEAMKQGNNNCRVL